MYINSNGYSLLALIVNCTMPDESGQAIEMASSPGKRRKRDLEEFVSLIYICTHTNAVVIFMLLISLP